MSNIITIGSEKKKKGGGTNAVLTLMKELSEFQDKVQTCIDSQDLADRKKELEVFYDKLDEMAEVLLGMAADGIKSKRKIEEIEEDLTTETPDELEEATQEVIDEPLSDRPQGSSVKRIQMVNAPSIPRIPR